MIKSKKHLPPYIENIARHLAEDVEEQIKPHRFIFERTKKESQFHYKVCRAGKHIKKREQEKVIAWAYVYQKGLCVSIICSFLGNSPIISKLDRRPRASWGELGRDECREVTYQVDDQSYKVLLDALVLSTKGWLG